MADKRAFTLIELLVIVGIIGAMLTAAVASVASGRDAFRMRTAVQRVMLLTRQARTMALLKQTPSVITFSELPGEDGFGGTCVTVESKSTEGAANAETGTGEAWTLGGERVGGEADEEGAEVVAAASDANEKEEDDPMDRIEDKTSFQGIRIKVEMCDDDGTRFGARKSKISVFSNVDFLQGRISESRVKSETTGTSAKVDDKEEDDDAKVKAEPQETVSVGYEPNGRCQPYRIVVYPDGLDESSGMVVEIDKFGKAQVKDGDE